jgi:hypothetical protein
MSPVKQQFDTLDAPVAWHSKPYLSWLIASNALSFYLYLFWDSLAGQIPVLSGAPSDMLFLQSDRFMDWINTLRSAGLLRPYGLEGQVAMPVYGPFTYTALQPVAKILLSGSDPLPLAKALWMVITAVVLLSAVRNIQCIRDALNSSSAKSVSPWLIASVILLSYPFMFAFDRGNLEMITFGLVCWYLTDSIGSYDSGEPNTWLQRLKADLVLAIAVCIKPYTCLFAVCQFDTTRRGFSFSRKRSINSLTRVSVLALLISTLCLLQLYHGNLMEGYREFHHWQQQFRSSYVIGGAGDLFYPSPYIAIKTLLQGAASPNLAVRIFLRVYPCAALLFSAAVFLIVYRSRSFTAGTRSAIPLLLTAICFTLLVFPFNANEYKAIYALLPFIHAYASPSDEGINASGSPTSRSVWRLHITPEAICIGLWFIILLNRYGLFGSKLIASMLASMMLIVFPFLLYRTSTGEDRLIQEEEA